MVMPGDDVLLTITLQYDVPIEEKQKITLREGNKTIGAGIVTQILE